MNYVELADRSTPVDINKKWTYDGKAYSVLRPTIAGIIDTSPDDASRRAALMDIGLLEVERVLDDQSTPDNPAVLIEETYTETDNTDHLSRSYLKRDMSQSERYSVAESFTTNEATMIVGMLRLLCNATAANSRLIKNLENTFDNEGITRDTTDYPLGAIETAWSGYNDPLDPDFQDITEQKLLNYMEANFQ